MAKWYPGMAIDGGKLTLELLLGSGSFGQVFKARHRDFDTPRAVKVIHPEGPPEARRLLQREVKAAERVRHANVATVYDANIEGGDFYVVYEYVRGLTVQEWLADRGAVTPLAAAELVAQMLGGLHAIHAAGIIHRDIAPKNVMFAVDGAHITAKIIDLGLAKLGADSDISSLSRPGNFIGTRIYSAPEQLALDAIDVRSDLYSAGLVLYELLTRSRPFPDADPLRRLTDPPAAVVPDANVPPDLATIVMKALARDPNDRFESAELFAAALRPFRDRHELDALQPQLLTIVERHERERTPATRPDAPTVRTPADDAHSSVNPNAPTDPRPDDAPRREAFAGDPERVARKIGERNYAEHAPPLRVFCSYASRDEAFREELEIRIAMLKRQGLITFWHFRQLEPGVEWDAEIRRQIDASQIILLLVSPDFLSSQYVWEREVMRAMTRHNDRTARVIPIILRPCDWRHEPLEKLQALPAGAKPIRQWADSDEAWQSVVDGLRRVIETIRTAGPATPSNTPREARAGARGKHRRPLRLIVMLVLVVALSATSLWVLPPSRSPAVRPPAGKPSATSTGRLIIDAHPWAHIDSVRNEQGQNVRSGDSTPLNVSLVPGRYIVVLRGPTGEARPLPVEISPNESVRLDETFTLPDTRDYLAAAGLSQ